MQENLKRVRDLARRLSEILTGPECERLIAACRAVEALSVDTTVGQCAAAMTELAEAQKAMGALYSEIATEQRAARGAN